MSATNQIDDYEAGYTVWVVFSHLELGQKPKKVKKPLTDVILRLQSACH